MKEAEYLNEQIESNPNDLRVYAAAPLRAP